MLEHIRRSDDFADKNMVQKGFTLVELLVVVVILGILAAVVVFAVGGTSENAEAKACQAEESTVEAAVEAYKAQTGDYPADVAALTAAGDNKFLRDTPTYWDVAAAGDGTLVGAGDNAVGADGNGTCAF